LLEKHQKPLEALEIKLSIGEIERRL